MSIWVELLIGGAIGLVIGHGVVAVIYRSVWGHWRFWERGGRR